MKPVLVVIAGPNGSGKTSFASKLLAHEWLDGCTYINPDNIARDVFGDWNSFEFSIKAANLAAEKRELCLLEKRSLVFETVLSASDKIDFILRAKERGFFVRLFFIGTDTPSINAARVAMRVMEGGHDVPIPKIISRYSKSIANCAVAASLVDRAYIYDNSADNCDSKLLFRVRNGNIEKIYDETHEWAQMIASVLQPQQKIIDAEQPLTPR